MRCEESEIKPDRKYQPSLLWAYAVDFAEKRHPERELRPTDITLIVYKTDGPGAYVMRGPKMYFADPPLGEYVNNIDQDSLSKNSETIGEVVIFDKRFRETVLIGKTYEAAWDKLTK